MPLIIYIRHYSGHFTEFVTELYQLLAYYTFNKKCTQQ